MAALPTKEQRGASDAMLSPSNSARIGIATLHYGYNEGAILQAYCLGKLLKELAPDATVEILDQRYRAKCAAQGPPRTARTIALQEAIDGWLPLSACRFVSDDHEHAFEYIRHNYDVIILGSDVLWKLKYTRHLFGLVSVQKYPFFTPFPNVYWPDRTIPIPKIAYAASVGTTDWKEIPNRHRRRMRDILSGFSSISVRDRRTFRFVEWLYPELSANIEIMPDPTFTVNVLDAVDRSGLRNRLLELGVDFSRPRCGFVAPDSNPVREAAAVMREKGYQIIGIGTKNSFSDVRLFEQGFSPLEWAATFGFMDMCVSERMHACIFCLLNQTPFVALDINECPGDPETKLTDLVGQFGLGEFCFPMGKVTKCDVVSACERIALSPWNWSGIGSVIERFREKARGFMNRAFQNSAC